VCVAADETSCLSFPSKQEAWIAIVYSNQGTDSIALHSPMLSVPLAVHHSMHNIWITSAVFASGTGLLFTTTEGSLQQLRPQQATTAVTVTAVAESGARVKIATVPTVQTRFSVADAEEEAQVVQRGKKAATAVVTPVGQAQASKVHILPPLLSV
jgi:hypothetical protein